jgi:hypothetical protein
MQNPNQIQLDFIEKIRGSMPPNLSLVDSLAEVLNLSIDSAYRRIRGATSLTLDEITKLCNYYKVSFDFGKPQGETGMVTFHYRTISDSKGKIFDYIGDLHNHLKKIITFKEREIIYAAEDVPVFHHFRYEHLTAFKIFYWEKSLLNEKMLSNAKFDFKKTNRELLFLARETYNLYVRIPTVEIWTEVTLDSTVKQIEYYYETGIITRDEALLIGNDVLQMMTHIEEMAVTSRKHHEYDENHQMYYSDVMVGTNAVEVNIDGNKMVFISFNTFNSLSTTNIYLTAEVDAWLRNLIKKSALVSGTNEKQRLQIFKKIRGKADAMMKRIEQSGEVQEA